MLQGAAARANTVDVMCKQKVVIPVAPHKRASHDLGIGGPLVGDMTLDVQRLSQIYLAGCRRQPGNRPTGAVPDEARYAAVTEDCSAVAAALNAVMRCVQSHAAGAQG